MNCRLYAYLFVSWTLALFFTGLPAPALAQTLCVEGNCQPQPDISVSWSQTAKTVRAGQPVTFTVSAYDADTCGDPEQCPDDLKPFVWKLNGTTLSNTGSSVTLTFYNNGPNGQGHDLTCTVDDANKYQNGDDAAVTVDFHVDVTGEPAETEPEHEEGNDPDSPNCPDGNEGGGGDDGGCDGGSGGWPSPWGPLAHDPVNAATGRETYHPRPDLVTYNPHGAPVSFQRTYYSGSAGQGYGSPGLSPGWLHNYDYFIRPQSTSS